MDDLLFSPITELAAAVRSRRLSPVELTRAYLDRIAKLDPTLRAFITVDGDGALAAARALEREATAGAWRGPLHGVPLAHKDLCLIAGLPTSCGTRTADYFVGAPPCTAVARLVAAGAITLGKLNMTELAMGPFGDNAHHGDVQNPWRLGHVSGGSSSGSGAAVAAALAAGALGTDTGGSIRLPAACCGVVGLKATYGRVSREKCPMRAITSAAVPALASARAGAGSGMVGVSSTSIWEKTASRNSRVSRARRRCPCRYS